MINRRVVFDSESRRIFPSDLPEATISLHAPASQCLLLLVQNPGTVLTQKFLFENIWGSNGAFVSVNTLYQNIALVRKGLKSAGIDDEVVNTVSRVGIKFTGEVITIDPDNSPQEFGTSLSPAINVETEAEDRLLISQEAISNPPIESDELVREEFTDETLNVKRQRSVSMKWGYILAILVFGVLMTGIYIHKSPKLSFFKDYQSIGTIENCKLYSSYFDKGIATRVFQAFYRRNDIDCKLTPFAYLTVNRLPEGDGLLMCDLPVENNKAQCSNILLLEAADDK